jgi:hypothetical protein
MRIHEGGSRNQEPSRCPGGALVGLTAFSSHADCGSLAAEVDARCYPDNLQAAVDEALSSDRPLVLPRGTYRVSRPLVVDYAAHAGTGFELISRGATIDGTSIADAPAVEILCSGVPRAAPTSCFYLHQEGTLFVNARSSGYAVVIGKPDFTDAHNSIKIDHLIANNAGSGGGVQLNYVLNADIFVVADSAGQVGLDLEQMQFSVLRGAASAANGTAIMMGPGYIFANTFQGLDLEASPVCVSDMHDKTTNNTWTSPYLNCETALVYSENTHTMGQINWQLGGAVRVPYTMK